jgi:hypothetical protein
MSEHLLSYLAISLVVNSVLTNVLDGIVWLGKKLCAIFWDRFVISFELSSGINTNKWPWFVEWSKRRLTRNSAYHVVLDESRFTDIKFEMAPRGTAISFDFQGRRFHLRISSYETPKGTHPSAEQRKHTALFWSYSVFSTDASRIFTALLRDMKMTYDEARRGSFKVEIPVCNNGYEYWKLIQNRPQRSFDTVVLPIGLRERMVADLDWFRSADAWKWYRKHGIPYHRGWLLTGPPGNGKSSFVAAVVSYLATNMSIISLSSSGIDDVALASLLANPLHPADSDAPPDTLDVYVLEDIDALTNANAVPGDGKKRVTMSGLLNALDGPAAPSGALFIITTNFPDKVDSRLLRPGRCDIRFELPPPTEEMARCLVEQLLSCLPRGEVQALVDRARASEKTFCMASVQQACMDHLTHQPFARSLSHVTF